MSNDLMNNCTPHKVKGVRETIEACGAKILYLPPYSSDFNPIELLWSKLKSFLKKTKARSKNLLERAVKSAFDSITHDDISAWFKHCDYYEC